MPSDSQVRLHCACRATRKCCDFVVATEGSTDIMQYDVEKFQQSSRVLQRFTQGFRRAYDIMVGAVQEAPQTPVPEESAALVHPDASAEADQGEAEKIAEARDVQVSAFRAECEVHCRREIDARLVALVSHGDHAELRKDVVRTRLYQNLGEDVPLMAFYDVKNAKMCAVYQGETLQHREPVIDVIDLERFLATVAELMKSGRDVAWIMAGRTESNLPKLRKILTTAGSTHSKINHKLNFDVFHMCYNSRQMQQYGHWKRERGLANSKAAEFLFCEAPKQMAKTRKYVDRGASLFNNVIRNVPVLAPKFHAMVSREVREVSLASMTGIESNSDLVEAEREQRWAEAESRSGGGEGGQEGAKRALDKKVRHGCASAFKKRRLYKHHTGTEVPWFPHDNDMDILKELCWNTGPGVRWVIHGTPAGGAGIQGCLEYGCSVVAACFDNFHREHLLKHIVERAVETVVSGDTTLFADEAIKSRMVELNLSKSDAGNDWQQDGFEAKKDKKDTTGGKKAKTIVTPKKGKGKHVKDKVVKKKAASGKKKPKAASVSEEPNADDESCAGSSLDEASSC